MLSIPTADPDCGLTTKQAEELLQEYGPNELDAQEQDSFLKILLSQMANLIFVLTSVASLICFLTGDDVKGTFLLVLVGVVCGLNALGEWSNQDASAALKAMNPESARVVRDGQLNNSFPIEDVALGDIVHLAMGDTVPADIEIIKCTDLQTNESVLTGEPNEVNKSAVPKQSSESQFPSNMLYKSTDVVAGSEVVGRVVATGMRTQVGLIAKRLVPKDNSVAKRINPLQRSINVLGTLIGISCAVVICIGAAGCISLEYRSLPPQCAPNDMSCLWYMSAVRGLLMAVAIIPHGLPLVVMVMLRVGARLMLEKNAVVTRQSAVDYLGAAHYICTDKTGTLTEGKMTAQSLVVFGRDPSTSTTACVPMTLSFYPVRGLDPDGSAYPSHELTPQRRAQLDKGVPASKLGLHDLGDPQGPVPDGLPLGHFARVCLASASVNCHGTKIAKKADNSWYAEGNMSEAALKVASIKGRYGDDSELYRSLHSTHVREEKLEVPFTSKRKMSATVHHITSGESLASLRFTPGTTHYAVLKGAPDRMLPHVGAVLQATTSGLEFAEGAATDQDRAVVAKQNGELAKQALRKLLLCVRPLGPGELVQLQGMESADDRLSLLLGGPHLAVLGLWGIFDPPRPSVPHSIRQCHDAGIEVVMITGDQRDTALAIGKLVGITEPASFAGCKNKSDVEIAKRCTDLHHEKPHLIERTPSQAGVGTPRSGRPRLNSSRSLRVHDERTQKDAHETEYKDDKDLSDLTSTVRIWSRASPSDKVCIVDSLCKQTRITAMTGDGVNDAPALKGADIGTAMGIAGTAVTRNSADLILKDDNFSTIVAAVCEGRKIYGNVQKYVVYNLSVKAGECCCLLIAIFCNLAMPVQGLQQLVNMVITHIIPPMALAWEDPEWYTMLVPPRDTETDLVVNSTLMLFRWLPFILCFAAVVMTNLCYGVWMHTGFVTVNALVGSSMPGAVTSGEAACQTSGQLDASGFFMEDAAPYHCRCTVRAHPWQAEEDARVVEQWGRLDASNFPMNRWTGDTGSAFDLQSTPFQANGEAGLLEHCVDSEGGQHMCWTNPETERPLLDMHNNCAMHGGMVGETMGYVSVQVGEVLSLMTYRTDDAFIYARTSYIYLGMLAFNLAGLLVVLYVPAVNELLELTPLTPLTLGFALLAPLAIVMLNELIKVVYRHQLAVQHALLGVVRPNLDELGKP